MANIYKKIYREIKKHQTIVIARHIGADPDALGSSFALKELIQNKFPKKIVYAIGNPSNRFKFMGLLDKPEKIEPENTLLIVLDTPDLKRVDGTKVSDLITIYGDVHHIFPKNYLKKNGITNKVKYNQVANYIYLDTQVNKAISDDAPAKYFSAVKDQCVTKKITIGNISDEDKLTANLAENCIPSNIYDMDVNDYDAFLAERRLLMADLIHRYYNAL